jgi:uncharacterized lipoprotein YbaY
MLPMAIRRARLAALLLLGLAGCAMTPEQTAPLRIHGELRLVGAAATSGEAVVELRDTTLDEVLAETRQPLPGDDRALPFVLQLPRQQLQAGHAYSVRAAVLAQGWAQWLSEPVTMNPQQGNIDVGTLTLARSQRPLAFQTRIDCAGRIFVVGMAGDVLTLRDGTRSFELKPAATAPEQRFEAAGDASTFVLTQGRSATVGVGGAVYAGCKLLR